MVQHLEQLMVFQSLSNDSKVIKTGRKKKTLATHKSIVQYLDYFSGMCFNVIFLACGMLNMEIWACFKYADIGFSIGLSFCFVTAGIAMSHYASGKDII